MSLPAGLLRGPLAPAGPEDMEQPMLLHTTALSDGYASPRSMPTPGPSRTHSDDEGDDGIVGADATEATPIAGRGRSSSTQLDLEVGDPEGVACQRRARDRCWGCTASRVGEVIIGNLHRFVLLGLIIALLILFSLKGVKLFGQILSWFEEQNTWWPGWVCFLLLFTANVALFLPGVALILGAGFVFGFWKGLLAVWVGGAIGQAAAFLLARYLVREWVVTYIARKWSKWDLVDDMIEEEGWILVVLLRLSPIVPWNVLNIAMATTRIHFVSFTAASAIGIGFESSLLTYFGSLAQDIHHIVGGKANPHGPVVYVLTATSLVFCAIAAVIATLYTKRALKRAAAQREANQRRLTDEDDAASPDAGLEPGFRARQEEELDSLCSTQPVMASMSAGTGILPLQRTTEPQPSTLAADDHAPVPSEVPPPAAKGESSAGLQDRGSGLGLAAPSKGRHLQEGIEMQVSSHSLQ